MPLRSKKIYLLESRSAFAMSLLLSFVIIFGVACIVAYISWTKAIDGAIRSNETRAALLSKLILEHERAATGVLRAYARRPELVRSVKTKDFEGTLQHLTDLTKNNPEMDWPFIANPDSTVWVNYPADRQVMNKDLSYRDWYKGVSKEWKPYISGVFKLIVGEKDLAIAVSVPIFDERGKVIGILSTAQSTAFFQKIISEAGLDLDAKITLIDQEGHIIYTNGFPYTKEITRYPLFEPVKRAVNVAKGGVKVRDVSDRGRVKYVSFVPIEGTGWSIFAEKARGDVLRSETSSLALIGVITLLIYGLAVLSLVHLRDRHGQIRELEKLNEELDDRVRERTAELEAKNQALREGEERLRQLIETSPVAIGFGDSTGKIFEANESFYRLTGYTREEIHASQLGWDRLTAPEYAKLDRQIMATLAATGSAGPYEKEYIRKDGSRVPLLLSVSKLPGRDEHIAFILDITERKQVEERLAAAHRQVQSIIDNTTSIVYALDLEERFLLANTAIAELLNSTPEQMIGKRRHEFMPKEDADWHEANDRQVIETGRALEFEEYSQLKGHSITWLTTKFPLRDGRGKIYAVGGISADVSERKRAEVELKESRRKYQALIETTGDFIWEIDSFGRYTYCSPQMETLWGIKPEEMIGKTPFDVMPAEQKNRAAESFIELAKSPRPFNGLESTAYDGHGRLIYIETGGVPFFGEDGKLLGFRGISRDITERIQAAESLRRNEARSRLLADTAGRLLATENPQTMVEELCHQVMAHLDCQAFFNFLIDEKAGRLHLNACVGIPEEEARKIEWLDYGVAVCGCVARDRARIIADDILHVPDPRTDLIKSYGIQAYCCHPLLAHDHLIGTLSFGTKNRPHFTSDEVETMRIVTDQVAIAMDRIRLLDTIRRSRDDLEIRVRERTAELANLSSQLVSAQEKERMRISYDLHDNVWQTLVAIRFEIERLFSRKDKVDWAALQKKSREVTADILGAVGKIRSMQGDLWPYVLDDIGIVATIDWYCREFEKSHSGLAIERKNDLAESEILASAKIVIYRILQETLSNVAKYSRANHVTVRLMKNGHGMEFTVQDDGIGFDPEETISRRVPWGGLGLLNIKARTELSGGTFGIESVKGKGTTIRATWPIGSMIGD